MTLMCNIMCLKPVNNFEVNVIKKCDKPINFHFVFSIIFLYFFLWLTHDQNVKLLVSHRQRQANISQVIDINKMYGMNTTSPLINNNMKK